MTLPAIVAAVSGAWPRCDRPAGPTAQTRAWCCGKVARSHEPAPVNAHVDELRSLKRLSEALHLDRWRVCHRLLVHPLKKINDNAGPSFEIVNDDAAPSFEKAKQFRIISRPLKSQRGCTKLSKARLSTADPSPDCSRVLSESRLAGTLGRSGRGAPKRGYPGGVADC